MELALAIIACIGQTAALIVSVGVSLSINRRLLAALLSQTGNATQRELKSRRVASDLLARHATIHPPIDEAALPKKTNPVDGVSITQQ